MVRAIDLFCGAGGSSYGARKAGVKIVGAFDMWEPAVKTYQANFPDTQTFKCNLTQLHDSEVESICQKLGRVDLILASPECTNHSRAKGNIARSEESKNTAFDVLKFATYLKPNWMIIENVVEMQNWDRHKEYLKKLWDMGYFVREVILNAKDFGVPQSRERLFLLCSLSGKSEKPNFSLEEKPISSVIDFSEKYKFSPLFIETRAKNTIASAERAINHLGKNEPFLLVYYGSGRKGNGGWQKIDKPIGTITTLDRFALVVPHKGSHQIRMLQPEELKRAMGFDDEFALATISGLSRRDRIKLMGNGVCPPVMKSIVESLCV